MNQKNIYIVVASSIMILFCLVYQGVYSYFSASIVDNRGENGGNTSITAPDLKDLTMISGENNGIDTLIPGESVTSTFSVKNDSNTPMCFDLVWTSVTNTFVNKADLIVTLQTEDGTVLLENTEFPSTIGTLLTGLKIGASTTVNYSLTVTYKNSEKDQKGDMGKSFGGTLSGQLIACPGV